MCCGFPASTGCSTSVRGVVRRRLDVYTLERAGEEALVRTALEAGLQYTAHSVGDGAVQLGSARDLFPVADEVNLLLEFSRGLSGMDADADGDRRRPGSDARSVILIAATKLSALLPSRMR